MSKRADEMDEKIFHIVLRAVRESCINYRADADAICLAIDVIRELNEAGYKIEKESADAGVDG